MPCIFIILDSGTAIRNVLRTDTFKILKEQDNLRIVIFSPIVDANFMQERHGVIKPAYNCQAAVTPEQVIVAYDTVLEATDIKQLEPMIEKVEENTLKSVEELKADCGYASEDNKIIRSINHGCMK